jgi:hypothetical protein
VIRAAFVPDGGEPPPEFAGRWDQLRMRATYDPATGKLTPRQARISEATFGRSGTRMRCQDRSRAAGRPVQIAAIGELASRTPTPLLDLGSIAIGGRPAEVHLETVGPILISRVGRGSTVTARRQPAGLA